MVLGLAQPQCHWVKENLEANLVGAQRKISSQKTLSLMTLPLPYPNARRGACTTNPRDLVF